MFPLCALGTQSETLQSRVSMIDRLHPEPTAAPAGECGSQHSALLVKFDLRKSNPVCWQASEVSDNWETFCG